MCVLAASDDHANDEDDYGGCGVIFFFRGARVEGPSSRSSAGSRPRLVTRPACGMKTDHCKLQSCIHQEAFVPVLQGGRAARRQVLPKCKPTKKLLR